MKSIDYDGETLWLDFSQSYTNGQPVILLQYAHGETYACATACTGEVLLDGETILDTNNLNNILEILIDEGIVSKPTGLSLSGWCTYPIVKIL